MNSTINEYMFMNTAQKNSDDLAAWCRNAFVSQWRYAENCFGERNGEDRIRYADNIGLIMGYIRYDNDSKTFTSDTVNTSETLNNSHRIPVNIIVYQVIAILQVLTFRDTIGCN